MGNSLANTYGHSPYTIVFGRTPSITTLDDDQMVTTMNQSTVNKMGGGGGGFRPIILETSIWRYGLEGKAKTRPDFCRVVLGPCAQFYPFEASEQKWD